MSRKKQASPKKTGIPELPDDFASIPGEGRVDMRPPPMVAPLEMEDVLAERQARIARNSGASVKGLRYAPQYANATPMAVDPPQYSPEEIARARFRREEGLEGDPIDKTMIVQQKLQAATERDKKLRLLRERGLL